MYLPTSYFPTRESICSISENPSPAKESSLPLPPHHSQSMNFLKRLQMARDHFVVAHLHASSADLCSFIRGI